MIDIVSDLLSIADASRRQDGSDIPLGQQLREAASRISQQDAEIERLRKENQSLTEASIIGEYMWTPAELHEARMEAFFVGWEMSNVASAEDTCAEAWEYFSERAKAEETGR